MCHWYDVERLQRFLECAQAEDIFNSRTQYLKRKQYRTICLSTMFQRRIVYTRNKLDEHSNKSMRTTRLDIEPVKQLKLRQAHSTQKSETAQDQYHQIGRLQQKDAFCLQFYTTT